MAELAKSRNKHESFLASHRTIEVRLEKGTFNSTVRVNSNIKVSAF